MLFMEKIALAAFGLTIETIGTVTITSSFDTVPKEVIQIKITFPERKDSAEIKAAIVKSEMGEYLLENVIFDDYLQGSRAFSLSEIYALCMYLTSQQILLQPFYAMIYNAYEIETIKTAV